MALMFRDRALDTRDSHLSCLLEIAARGFKQQDRRNDNSVKAGLSANHYFSTVLMSTKSLLGKGLITSWNTTVLKKVKLFDRLRLEPVNVSSSSAFVRQGYLQRAWTDCCKCLFMKYRLHFTLRVQFVSHPEYYKFINQHIYSLNVENYLADDDNQNYLKMKGIPVQECRLVSFKTGIVAPRRKQSIVRCRFK